MWESLLNDCQIVLLPFHGDQNINARFMVEEINVAVEVERAENWWFTKESLSEAIGSVMDEDSKVGSEVKSNHAKLKEIVLDHDKQGGYIDSFIRNLQDLLE
ncbi:hypothetical protein L1049_000094 [Liquidambar formosana]|uniref:Uncharacterized protein n=1 Tax=Liquidambar formosana TaxID=63359 RepID=A0AAP0N8B4_LIQFO